MYYLTVSSALGSTFSTITESTPVLLWLLGMALIALAFIAFCISELVDARLEQKSEEKKKVAEAVLNFSSVDVSHVTWNTSVHHNGNINSEKAPLVQKKLILKRKHLRSILLHHII